MSEAMCELVGTVLVGLFFLAQNYADSHPVNLTVATVRAPIDLVARMAAKRGSGRVADGPKGVLGGNTLLAAHVPVGAQIGAIAALTHVWDSKRHQMVPVPSDLGTVLSIFVTTPNRVHSATGDVIHTSRMVSVTSMSGTNHYRYGIPHDAIVRVKE